LKENKNTGTQFLKILAGLLLAVTVARVEHGAYGQTAVPQERQCHEKDAPVLGINRTNLGRLSEFQPVLDNIHDAGIRDIRLTLDPPLDNTVRTISYATRLGFRVLFVISLGWPSFNVPDAALRPGRSARFFPVHRLSDLDLAAYKIQFANILDKIEESGGRVAAFQIGNEINWAAFNGDLPLPPSGSGIRYTIQNFGSAPEASQIERGFQKYGAALAMTRQILESSKYHKNAKIISAGLTDGGGMPNGASIVGYDLAIQLFKKYHVFDNIDGIGIHIYPVAPANSAGRFDKVYLAVLRLTKICSEFADKSCWITEWGFRSKTKSCTSNDTDRLELMRDFQKSAACLRSSHNIVATYLFAWDNGGENSVWRCGHLTQAGQIFNRGNQRHN
jgi:hypothetical protein